MTERLNKRQAEKEELEEQLAIEENKRICLVLNLVITNPTANFVPVHVLPKGLLPDAVYSVGGEFECSGLTLMRGGYTFPRLSGDYPSLQIDIIRKQ